MRIDAVVDAASGLSDPISEGETIVVQGAGFGPGAQLLIQGMPVAPLSISLSRIAANVPALTGDAATVQVSVDGTVSNSVLVARAH